MKIRFSQQKTGIRSFLINFVRWLNVNQPLISILAIFSLAVAGGLTLGHFLPPWESTSFKSGATSILRWDGMRYWDIAQNGYRWLSQPGQHSIRLQSVAFFPLYPVIERVMIALFGKNIWLNAVFPGFILGLWSIAAFSRLANGILGDQRRAQRATALYALWPASCFFVVGYPTGLINLCAIAAISAMIDGRTTRAALWCGLGTAAAPTMVFFAAGLCLAQLQVWWLSGHRLSGVIRLGLFGLTTVWGISVLMFYFGWRFGHPLLFIGAQNAWGSRPPWSIRLLLLVNPLWYLYPFVQTASLIQQATTHVMISSWQFRDLIVRLLQRDVDVIAIIAIISTIIITRRLAIPAPPADDRADLHCQLSLVFWINLYAVSQWRAAALSGFGAILIFSGNV